MGDNIQLTTEDVKSQRSYEKFETKPIILNKYIEKSVNLKDSVINPRKGEIQKKIKVDQFPKWFSLDQIRGKK